MTQVQRILHPTDFSQCSLKALDLAQRLSHMLPASLTLFHVADLRDLQVGATSMYAGAAGAEWLQPAIDQRLLEAKARLGELCRPQDQKEVRIGAAAPEIIARSADTDLVVMGTHSRTGLAHLFLGSVAEATVRASPAPVITVPLAANLRPPRLILVATDFSPSAHRALSYARLLAAATGADLAIVHVLDETRQASPEQAHQQLAQLASDLSQRRRLLVAGKPAPAILELATDLGVDFIALGTHGRTGLARLMFGSVAEHTVCHSLVPVLTARELPTTQPQ
ncbi:MAG: universal stress protein [Deinococcus sp.]|nr:universal stress protein [Deinococcus sp.]